LFIIGTVGKVFSNRQIRVQYAPISITAKLQRAQNWKNVLKDKAVQLGAVPVSNASRVAVENFARPSAVLA